MEGPKVVCDPRGCGGGNDGGGCNPSDSSFPPIHLPVLSGEDVIRELRRRGEHANWSKFCAMYSSVVGGVTTDPAAMIIPLDDHMVHRGHAVFDTAMVCDGYAHQVDAHLDRLFRSMAMAKLPPPFPREILRDIILQTAAISQCRNCQIRYWVSSGPGGFGLLPSECPRSAFYVVVFDNPLFGSSGGGGGRAVNLLRAVTTSVPIKPPPFCLMKTNNYIQNVMAAMDAKSKGADVAVWRDQDGCLAEGPVVSILIVDSEGYLTSPTSDTALRGCTAERAMELARQRLSTEGHMVSLSGRHVAAAAGVDRFRCLSHALPIKGVRVRKIPIEEARKAKEMFVVGSTVIVQPIVEWDGRPVGDGRPGPVAAALYEMMEDDIRNGESYGRMTRTPIPYAPSTATTDGKPGSPSQSRL